MNLQLTEIENPPKTVIRKKKKNKKGNRKMKTSKVRATGNKNLESNAKDVNRQDNLVFNVDVHEL